MAEIEARLGNHVYAYDDEPLEAAVVRLFARRGLTLALAESCTGGLLGARITDVPGSSRVLLGGAIVYSNEAKSILAGVDPALIARHGAVSAEVASALAEGARAALGAHVGVGITGVAGPDGGTQEKPVGLVYLAIAREAGTQVEGSHYIGIRRDVRYKTTQTALNVLRDLALAEPCP